MTKRYYYKAVNVVNDKFYSSNNSAICPRLLKIRYKYKQFVYPKIEGSKLFVFNSLEDAVSFVSKKWNGKWRIYECEVINPVRMLPICNITKEAVEDFWRLKNENKSVRLYKRLRLQSSACDAVKLTKLVYKEGKYV